METFSKGDIVQIRAQWRDRPEDCDPYIITEWNDDRGYITPLKSKLIFKGSELVREYMIERVKP